MTEPINHPSAFMLAQMGELRARLQRVEKHLGITTPPHAHSAALSQLDRADNTERARTLLRQLNGYDPTPEEEAEADARPNALAGRTHS